MFVGRTLYILGMLFVFFSTIVLVMMFFTSGGNILIPVFAILNGFMAMGIGEIVIDLNYKKSLENNKREELNKL
ncbi:hypothetical protein [Halalkalibacter akibai]|uniref:Uncharacterized protein n=1 Tax=Halalkalibacter akibai (strain ATCC 43226 / DSM 21942 / CIP 109018 / JCM 9157 / 1139) TaxID=1236973 RepID=W4QZ79_HALA3|nr:hypothetical protein [Halalkalibacter akibai]GAE37425.1 hypothetical protein JCM9157_4724 [Halalkalibacter akibai JCM 9157]